MMMAIKATQKQKQNKSLDLLQAPKTRGVPTNCRCSGWAPQTGKWKDQGYKCAAFGWTMPWCYVVKDYAGPGMEFQKPSDTYAGKFYAPCMESNTTRVSKECRVETSDSPAQDTLNAAEDAVEKNPDNPLVTL